MKQARDAGGGEKSSRWWFRATWEERSHCQMVENSGGKSHLMLVVCIKSLQSAE
jgi:hypothetical protein